MQLGNTEQQHLGRAYEETKIADAGMGAKQNNLPADLSAYLGLFTNGNKSAENKNLIISRIDIASSFTDEPEKINEKGEGDRYDITTLSYMETESEAVDIRAEYTVDNGGNYIIEESYRNPQYKKFFASDAHLAQIDKVTSGVLPETITMSGVTNTKAKKSVKAIFDEAFQPRGGKIALNFDPKGVDSDSNRRLNAILTDNPNGKSTVRIIQDFNNLHDSEHWISSADLTMSEGQRNINMAFHISKRLPN